AGGIDGPDRLSVNAGHRQRDPDSLRCRSDVLGGAVLGGQFRRGEHRVGDLEHTDWLVGVVLEQEVLVLLAAKGIRGDGKAEVCFAQLLGLLVRDALDRQFWGSQEVVSGHGVGHGAAAFSLSVVSVGATSASNWTSGGWRVKPLVRPRR